MQYFQLHCTSKLGVNKESEYKKHCQLKGPLQSSKSKRYGMFFTMVPFKCRQASLVSMTSHHFTSKLPSYQYRKCHRRDQMITLYSQYTILTSPFVCPLQLRWWGNKKVYLYTESSFWFLMPSQGISHHKTIARIYFSMTLKFYQQLPVSHALTPIISL